MRKSFNQKGQYPSKTLFVGIDIAKNKHCCRALNSSNSQESKAMFFDNRKEGFEELTRRISQWCLTHDCTSVVIGMEPTSVYWRTLFYYLEQKGFNVKLVSSLKVKHSKDIMDNSPLKCDQKDALLIARLVKDGNVLKYRSPDKNILSIKKLIRIVEDLDKTASYYKNQLECFLSIHFPEINDVFFKLGGPTMRALLKEYPFPEDMRKADSFKIKELLRNASHGQINEDEADYLLEMARDTVGVPEQTSAERLEIKNTIEMLELTDKNIKEVKARIKEILEPMPQYQILKSIPGISVMTSAVMTAALGDLSQYKSANQVLKKAGLNLYSFASGNYQGAERISRRGMALLRKYLFMSALLHTRYGFGFNGKYNSMVNRGVAKKKVLVCIMRKLIKTAYALVRDNRIFKDYEPGAKRDVNVIKWAEAA